MQALKALKKICKLTNISKLISYSICNKLFGFFARKTPSWSFVKLEFLPRKDGWIKN